ncbi:retrovirus-related pol polyprotein from transposon TNT 1-94 [Tanacetum coccineum]
MFVKEGQNETPIQSKCDELDDTPTRHQRTSSLIENSVSLNAFVKHVAPQTRLKTLEVCLKCDLRSDDWIVDSRCTKQMTGNRRLFTTYAKYDDGHAVFGSNLKGKVVGEGNISHEFITITNVEHVSGLAFNLINVGQLCDDDCVVKFTKVDCTVSKNDKTLAKGHRRNGLYTCKLGDNSKQQICLASMVYNSTLWHRRLGHINMRTINEYGEEEKSRDPRSSEVKNQHLDTINEYDEDDSY